MLTFAEQATDRQSLVMALRRAFIGGADSNCCNQVSLCTANTMCYYLDVRISLGLAIKHMNTSQSIPLHMYNFKKHNLSLSEKSVE